MNEHSNASDAAGARAQPRASLSLVDAIALTVGHVVGIGIFKAPSIVANNVDSGTAFLMLWLVGGVISLVGALCYAELGSAYPSAGGEYHFINRAYGGAAAFLFAWARLAAIQTGVIAAIAYVFGDYASILLPLGNHGSAIYAALLVIAVTAINMAGTRQGKWAQNLTTLALVGGILLLVIAGVGPQSPAIANAAVAGAGEPKSYGLAMIFILLTYGGWNEAAYLTGEMHDVRRNVLRTLAFGIAAIVVLYLSLNFAYLNTLGLQGIRDSKVVGADLMRAAVGENAAIALSLLVMVAASSTLNASVFTGARSNYALGRDFRALGYLGKWNARSGAPGNALLVQGGIALALVVFASFTRDGFSTMVDFTAPVFWFFFLLIGLSLFKLRRREAAASVGFRVPLYPYTPALFCCACLYMLYSSLAYARFGSLVGVAVLLAGVPVLILARRKRAATGH